MPRVCSVCAHAKRNEIDAALVKGEAYRNIAERFRVSLGALHRHGAEHLPAHLAKAEQAREVAAATDIMGELQRCFERVNLLFDACDRWLRDADDATRYDIGPRSEDVTVTYSETSEGGKTVRRKEKLSVLLERVSGSGRTVEWGETKHADPRTLVLKTAERLQGQTELLAKLMGELDERPQINVALSAEWMSVRTVLLEALNPYPDARAAVAQRLMTLEVGSAARG